MERADVGAFRIDKIQDDDFFPKIVEFDDLTVDIVQDEIRRFSVYTLKEFLLAPHYFIEVGTRVVGDGGGRVGQQYCEHEE